MADELLQMFQSITTSDHDELVEQFAQLLQVSPQVAGFFLESSNWNVETAVNTYLATMEAQDQANAFSGGPPRPQAGEDLDMEADDAAPTPSAGLDSAPVECQAQLISDLSQSQNMLFLPSTAINMQWSFINTGDHAWPDETSLVFAQGVDFGGPQQISVRAEPKARVDIQTSLQLPNAPGSYAGAWRLRSSQGFFGDPVWVILNVGDANGAPVAPQHGSLAVNPSDPTKLQELQGGAQSGAGGFAPGVVEDMDL